MNKASLKSNNRKDSSISGRTTKTASAPRTSAKTSARSSKNIVKGFMKGLTTTEELMKKEDYKDKGLVKLINLEFNAVVKGLLLNKNDKIPKF
jgi:hypothetical protein